MTLYGLYSYLSTGFGNIHTSVGSMILCFFLAEKTRSIFWKRKDSSIYHILQDPMALHAFQWWTFFFFDEVCCFLQFFCISLAVLFLPVMNIVQSGIDEVIHARDDTHIEKTFISGMGVFLISLILLLALQFCSIGFKSLWILDNSLASSLSHLEVSL